MLPLTSTSLGNPAQGMFVCAGLNEFGFVEKRMGGLSGGICGKMDLENWGEKFMEVFRAMSAGGAWRC